MKKKTIAEKLDTSVVPQHRSSWGFLRKVFAGFLGDDGAEYQSEFQAVLGKLRDIDDTLEIIAREIARQAKRDK